MKPRIALVGCGRWGRHILRDLLALDCEVSVAEHSPDYRAGAVAAGAAMAVECHDDLPADLDGFVVATQTVSHAEVVESLLSRGRPIFVEKPLSDDLGSAVRIAERGGDRVFVMEKWRYHPGVEALAAIARSGELGKVERLSVKRLQWGCNHLDVDPLWILLPHDVSILDEVLGGALHPLWANAEIHQARPVGLVAAFDNAWIEASTRRSRYDRTLELVCADGVARLSDPMDDHIAIFRDDGDPMTHQPAHDIRPISTELPLLRELRAFRDHLSGGPPPKASAAVGARTVSVIVRLRELAGL